MCACPLQLSETQLDEFRECFNAFDKDGGGSIDSTELGARSRDPSFMVGTASAVALSVRGEALATLPERVPSCVPVCAAPEALMNSLGQEPSPAELEKMVELADADGSGDIDFVEFVTLIAHKMHDDEKEEDSDDKLKKAFAIFVRAAQSKRPAHPSTQPLLSAPAAHQSRGVGGTDLRLPLRVPPTACASRCVCLPLRVPPAACASRCVCLPLRVPPAACASHCMRLRCIRLTTGHRRLGPDRRRRDAPRDDQFGRGYDQGPGRRYSGCLRR